METEEKWTLRPEEIGLLKEVARWRRANGVTYFQWRPGKGFGVMTEWKLWIGTGRERKVANVTYEPARDWHGARLAGTTDYYGSVDFKELPANTVVEAIDMLVVLGYLPVRFSSAYRAGWNAAAAMVRAAGVDLVRAYEGER